MCVVLLSGYIFCIHSWNTSLYWTVTYSWNKKGYWELIPKKVNQAYTHFIHHLIHKNEKSYISIDDKAININDIISNNVKNEELIKERDYFWH